MTWQDEYQSALKSEHWKKLKRIALSRSGESCERCKVGRECALIRLELHHKHYRTLGRETPGDVELLCQKCHITADGERAKESREYAAEALEDARFYGWARKVYGEDSDYIDEDARERYEEWRERREYGDYSG